MEMEILEGLPEMNMDLTETGCCPRFEPEKWDNKIMTLKDLQMVKASTKSFLYMPLNMGKVMTQTMKVITAADAAPKDRYLILSQDVSMWHCDHFFLVNKEVPGMDNQKLSGTFMTMAFNGDYGQIPKWIKLLNAKIESEGKTMKKVFAFYTTCPKCAKYYGRNDIVLLGEI